MCHALSLPAAAAHMFKGTQSDLPFPAYFLSLQPKACHTLSSVQVCTNRNEF